MLMLCPASARCSLHGACWFSCLDIKSAYWQVEVEEADKEKIAFTVGPLGFYACNQMPFGLFNAPATFQRLMENCFGDMNMQSCLIYLVDIVVFSRTFDEHVQRLSMVFERLIDAGLKLSLRNVSCFRTKSSTLARLCLQMVFPQTQKRSGVFRSGLFHRILLSCKVSWVLWDITADSSKIFHTVSRPLYEMLKGSGCNKKKQKRKQSSHSRKFVWQ